MQRFERFRTKILAARSEDGLVDVMRDFCMLWMPSDLARLPADCQACEVRSPDDITSLALALTKCDLRIMDPELSQTLQVMSRTFVLASEQLRRIRPPPLDIDPQATPH